MAGTDELQRRLGRLAEDAPADRGGDAAALWDRGRRAHRRHLAGVAGGAIAVVVLVALAAGLPGWLREAPQPAAPPSGLTLPDRFWVPSPWQEGTTREPGRIVALMASEDREIVGDDRAAVTGVDASGEYHLLDLPGWAGSAFPARDAMDSRGTVAISADGTRVAYWSSAGEASGPLNTSEGPAPTAVSVLETTTGSLRTHEVPSEHGLRTTGLRWAGDRLWLDWGYFEGGGDGTVGSGAEVAVWDVAGDPGGSAVERLTGYRYVGGLGATSVWRGRPVVGFHQRVTLLSRDSGRRSYTLDRGVTDILGGASVRLAADGRVAALEDRDGRAVLGDKPVPLVVSRQGLTDGRQPTRLRRVGDVRALSVLGWRDEHHVVVHQGDAGAFRSVDDAEPTASLVSVDVRDGSTRVLSRVPGVAADGGVGGLGLGAVGLATEALAAPVLGDAPEPPQPWDPGLRLVLAAAAALLLGGLATHLFRRRRGLP